MHKNVQMLAFIFTKFPMFFQEFKHKATSEGLKEDQMSNKTDKCS